MEAEDLSVVIPILSKKQAPPPSRITLRLDFYCEHDDEVATFPVNADQPLESVGIEPYVRKSRAITDQPSPLPLGDLNRDEVGQLVVVNLGEDDAILDGFVISSSGVPFVGWPTPDQPLMVHCPNGSTVLRVGVFPK